MSTILPAHQILLSIEGSSVARVSRSLTPRDSCPDRSLSRSKFWHHPACDSLPPACLSPSCGVDGVSGRQIETPTIGPYRLLPRAQLQRLSYLSPCIVFRPSWLVPPVVVLLSKVFHITHGILARFHLPPPLEDCGNGYSDPQVARSGHPGSRERRGNIEGCRTEHSGGLPDRAGLVILQ